MPSLRARAKRLACASIAILTSVGSPAAGRTPSGDAAKTAACAAPAYREFDFWIGDWDAFDMDKPGVLAARNQVKSTLGGCAVYEDYRGSNGLQGESFTVYDESRHIWHQTWVTNAGSLLVIEGTRQNGEMVLTGVDHRANGKQVLVHVVWKPVKEGVQETALTSQDGGKTWEPLFDMLFRPHAR